MALGTDRPVWRLPPARQRVCQVAPAWSLQGCPWWATLGSALHPHPCVPSGRPWALSCEVTLSWSRRRWTLGLFSSHASF